MNSLVKRAPYPSITFWSYGYLKDFPDFLEFTATTVNNLYKYVDFEDEGDGEEEWKKEVERKRKEEIEIRILSFFSCHPFLSQIDPKTVTTISCDDVSLDMVVPFRKYFPNLENLKFSCLYGPGDRLQGLTEWEDREGVLLPFKRLRELEIDQVELTHLQLPKTLTILRIRISETAPEPIERIFHEKKPNFFTEMSSLPNLTDLSVNFPISSEFRNNFPSLESLSISLSSIMELREFGKYHLPNLKKLDLENGCGRFEVAAELPDLNGFSNLKKLELSSFSDIPPEKVSKLRNIKYIYIRQYRASTVLTGFRGVQEVKKVYLSSSGSSESTPMSDDIITISGFLKLKHLSIRGQKEIDSDSFRLCFPLFGGLTKLMLYSHIASDTAATLLGDGISNLSPSCLRTLELEVKLFPKANMEIIGRLRNLRRFRLDIILGQQGTLPYFFLSHVHILLLLSSSISVCCILQQVFDS